MALQYKQFYRVMLKTENRYHNDIKITNQSSLGYAVLKVSR